MAGAKHGKHSKHQKQSNARYGRPRPAPTREPLPKIIIVCDDTRTAVDYFKELAREVKQWVTLRVIPAPKYGATPTEVLEEAKKHRPDSQEEKDSTWALIDVEGPPARQRAAHAAKEAGRREGVRVALSKPCFEVWTLLHLADEGAAREDCASVRRRLSVLWKKEFNIEFNKSTADYAKITKRIRTAARRAQAHKKQKCTSWTEVYELAEEILRLVPANILPDTKP